MDRDSPGRTNGNAVSNPRNQSLITDVFRSRPLLCTIHSRHPSSQQGSQRAINPRPRRLTRDIRVRWHFSEVTDEASDFRLGVQSGLNANVARTAGIDAVDGARSRHRSVP